MAERAPSPLMNRHSDGGFDGGPLPAQIARDRAENEAQNAVRLSSPRLGPAPAGPVAAQLSGFGRPLPDGLRRTEETRLGADLSRVRLHDDATARDALGQSHARGLAQGQDIAVSPADARGDTPQSAALLRHEINHTVQQTVPGGATLTQRDGGDGDGERGIGRTAPNARVTRMDSPGSEDAHALFDNDSASLSAAGASSLATLSAGQSGDVVVMIHGYASVEGADDYNRNLSAHRAVAARDALIPLLPAGTRFMLYSHGETDGFGDASANRRVGVDVITPDDGSFLSGSGPLSLFPRRPRISLFGPGELTLRAPGEQLAQVPHPSQLTAEDLGIDVPSPTPDQGEFGPRVAPSNPQLFAPPPSRFDTGYDWSSVARDASSRGVRFRDGDHTAITDHYYYWRLRYVQLGLSSSLATDAAQLGTDIMVGIHLSNTYPNQFESFDQQWDTELPPVFTIVNETRMIWVYEKFRDMIGDD